MVVRGKEALIEVRVIEQKITLVLNNIKKLNKFLITN